MSVTGVLEDDLLEPFLENSVVLWCPDDDFARRFVPIRVPFSIKTLTVALADPSGEALACYES